MGLNESAIIPVLLLLLAGIGWLYRHEKERRLLIEKQLSERKYDVYYRLMTMFFDVLKNIGKNVSSPEQELAEKMIDIKKDLTVFASDEVLKKFFHWLRNVDDSKVVFKNFAELLLAIRKDMGNPATKITTEEFIRSLLKSDTDFELLKKQGYVL